MNLDPALFEQLLCVFRVELDDQLQCITAGLLSLEKEPDARVRADALNQIFRAAHNIKGSGRAVNVTAVADIAHRMESLFSQLKHGGVQPAPTVVDLGLETVDAMRAAMQVHEAGGDVDFDLAALLERLDSAAESTAIDTPGPHSPNGSALSAARETPTAAAPSRSEALEPSPATGGALPGAEAPESIRVTTARLDGVAALAEDLQVTKIGLDDHQAAIGHVMRRLETLQATWTRSGGQLHAQPSNSAHGEFGTLLQRAKAEVEELTRSVARAHKDLRATSHRIGFISAALQLDLRTLRLMPAASLLQPLRRSVRDLARELDKQVHLEIVGDDIELDRMILDGLRDPLLHLLRNAIDHGIETAERRLEAGKPVEARIAIEVSHESGQILFRVRDDGAGIDVDHIARLAVAKKLVGEREIETLDRDALLDLIFRPGFSSKLTVSDISGRGVGLDVVRISIAELKGTVCLHSTLGEGTDFELRVPLTLTTERGLHVRTGRERFVVPSTAVERIVEVSPADIACVEGREVVLFEGRSLPLRPLVDVLELGPLTDGRPDRMPVILVNDGRQCVGLIVDEVIGEREIVVKRLQPPLVSVRNVSGATHAGDGTITIVLSPSELVASALRPSTGAGIAAAPGKVEPEGPASILVVDDSITTRTLERNILEAQGYRVNVAINGAEAWDALQRQAFDLVVTDIEMPTIDGFTLTRRIKQSETCADLPVIIVSSLASDAEKRRGIEVGADAYIVKGQFETQVLLDAVQRFV